MVPSMVPYFFVKIHKKTPGFDWGTTPGSSKKHRAPNIPMVKPWIGINDAAHLGRILYGDTLEKVEKLCVFVRILWEKNQTQWFRNSFALDEDQLKQE